MTTETDGSTGEDTTDGTVTTPTTTINPSTTIDPSTTTVSETDTDDTTTTDPTDATTDTTDTTTEPDTGSSTTDDEPVCGDGRIGGDEECDTTNLDLLNCIALDFDGGTLACTDDCQLDTSGCTTCGDMVIAGDEECDTNDFGGATCESEGFVSGSLACTNDCALDTSGCSACGDGDIDAGEECDGTDLGGMGCTDLGMGFTGGVLACNGECGYDTTGCTSFALPGTGELVVTEIMRNPETVVDADGEWFEIHNPSSTTSYQLGGCIVESNNDPGFTIEADLVIGPGEYVLFGEDTALDPGFVADYEWPSGNAFVLANGADTISLSCGGTLVDEVSYTSGAPFPNVAGAAMNLDPGSYDAAANDDGNNWCAATQSYNGDLGTPGTANTVCDEETTYTIDFCRLQSPTTISEVEGTDVLVYGRVFVAGLTDLSPTNDPAAEVRGYVGYGPDGTDPAVDGSWVWTTATPNAGYGPGSPGHEPNNDEYQATLSVPSPPGSYDFAFRFSGDSGATFTYCDGDNEGSSDGYQIDEAGQMTSTAAPPPVNMYFSEYVEGSSFNKAIEIYNAADAAGDLDLCSIEVSFNGGSSSGSVPLSGSLAPGDVVVICHPTADENLAPHCDAFDSDINWNGDDAFSLVCQATTLDVFGQIGVDPGTEWTGGTVNTLNETLRRLCSVTSGDPDGDDEFDPSLEWEEAGVDNFDDLGQYSCE